MEIVQRYLTKNRCYKLGATIMPQGIMVHSLGVAQPDGNKIADSWDNADVSKAVHAFVTTDKVIHTLPWNMRCWGSGTGTKGTANNTHIQFEICEPKGHKYGQGSTMIGYDVKANEEYFKKIWDNSVDLCVMLCLRFNLPAETIICHSEGYRLGIATNHGDVMHWFPKHGKTIDDFRKEVKQKMAEQTYVPSKTITPKSDTKDIKWLQERVNKNLPKIPNITPLVVDGDYGNKTRIAVLILWELWKWNKEGKDDGWKAGKKTITALNK